VKHPIQPIEADEHGVLRFKKNEIVRFLLDEGGIGLNMIAILAFSREDREQFAQLIGYSLSGAAELDYVSDETLVAAKKMMYDKEKSEVEARCECLQAKLSNACEHARRLAATLFSVCEEDLKPR
jgi:hypothetical protein